MTAREIQATTDKSWKTVCLSHPPQMALVELLGCATHGEPLPVGLEGLIKMPHIMVHHRQKECCAIAAGVPRALPDERGQVKLQGTITCEALFGTIHVRIAD